MGAIRSHEALLGWLWRLYFGDPGLCLFLYLFSLAPSFLVFFIFSILDLPLVCSIIRTFLYFFSTVQFHNVYVPVHDIGR